MENHDTEFPNMPNFDITQWIDTVGIKLAQSEGCKLEPLKEQTCGFAACALGSAAAHSWFNKRGLSFDKDLTMAFSPIYAPNGIGGETFGGFAAGEKFFGISEVEAEFLFDPEEYACDDSDVTTNMVAERIDFLIDNYTRFPNEPISNYRLWESREYGIPPELI